MSKGQRLFPGSEETVGGTLAESQRSELPQDLDSRVLRSCPLGAGPRLGPALSQPRRQYRPTDTRASLHWPHTSCPPLCQGWHRLIAFWALGTPSLGPRIPSHRPEPAMGEGLRDLPGHREDPRRDPPHDSSSPSPSGFNSVATARIFYKLMLRLGFQEFYLQGGDWGALICTNMAQLVPR